MIEPFLTSFLFKPNGCVVVFLYPKSRPRHFLTFLGFSWAWVFPGLRAHDLVQVNKTQSRVQGPNFSKIPISNVQSKYKLLDFPQKI
ncbi:unnamed protein product [Meloidogyne enterolobii]|uniref:Uncharacterized protein n=1 Tax=Meloidogyne enterolobii TaxID=390850 RepID=A0ACB0YWU6_MELEN